MCFPEEELQSQGGSRCIEVTNSCPWSPCFFTDPAWLKLSSLMEAPLGACLVGLAVLSCECAGTLSFNQQSSLFKFFYTLCIFV